MSEYDFEYKIQLGISAEDFRIICNEAMAKAAEDQDNIVTVYFEPGVYTILKPNNMFPKYGETIHTSEIPWIRLETRKGEIAKIYAPLPMEGTKKEIEPEREEYIPPKWVW
jgi:hypothetical protein